MQPIDPVELCPLPPGSNERVGRRAEDVDLACRELGGGREGDVGCGLKGLDEAVLVDLGGP
eukprot:13069414-Heterocapsa_arctica.AAC.1